MALSVASRGSTVMMLLMLSPSCSAPYRRMCNEREMLLL
jgi:hypothetical protein